MDRIYRDWNVKDNNEETLLKLHQIQPNDQRQVVTNDRDNMNRSNPTRAQDGSPRHDTRSNVPVWILIWNAATGKYNGEPKSYTSLLKEKHYENFSKYKYI